MPRYTIVKSSISYINLTVVNSNLATYLMSAAQFSVIMEKKDYIAKMDEQLNNPLHYEKSDQDHTDLHISRNQGPLTSRY